MIQCFYKILSDLLSHIQEITEQSYASIINNKSNKIRRMTKTLYLLQGHKFRNENIEATLACPKCEEIFKKEFPLDLEGQITEFKCPVCNSASEADLPSKGIELQAEFEGDLYETGEENTEEESDESY